MTDSGCFGCLVCEGWGTQTEASKTKKPRKSRGFAGTDFLKIRLKVRCSTD